MGLHSGPSSELLEKGSWRWTIAAAIPGPMFLLPIFSEEMTRSSPSLLDGWLAFLILVRITESQNPNTHTHTLNTGESKGPKEHPVRAPARLTPRCPSHSPCYTGCRMNRVANQIWEKLLGCPFENKSCILSHSPSIPTCHAQGQMLVGPIAAMSDKAPSVGGIAYAPRSTRPW